MKLPLLELIFELHSQKTQKVAIEVFDMVMLQRKYDYSRKLEPEGRKISRIYILQELAIPLERI